GNVETKGELLDITLNYNKDFGDSQLTALVGYSFQSYQRKGKSISALGFSTTHLSQMIADMETAASSAERQLSGSYQQFGHNSTNTFVNRLFPAVSQNEARSEEHTSELQSRENLVCRLLLEKKEYQ